MIGDWVYAIDGDCKKHPCRIATLEYDSTNEKDDFSIDFYGTDYEVEWPDVAFEVEPIPLTPEILEKNGFVPDNFSPYYLSIEDGSIRFSEHQYGLYCNILRSYQRYDGVCNYVHELQHALKLCGIDKEIVI